MSRAIIVKRISRRTGKRFTPRSLVQTGRVTIPAGTTPSKAAAKVLTQVKAMTRKDGNDRQIELAEVIAIGGTRHDIKSRVLFRVYLSDSDGLIHVYKGASQRAIRKGKPSGSVEAQLVSVG